jgi:two-component system response regulator AtoC
LTDRQARNRAKGEGSRKRRASTHEPHGVLGALEAANGTAGRGAEAESDYLHLLEHGVATRAIHGLIAEVADTNATVLIRGESGVGKDVVARAIVQASKRPDQPFVKINCAALPTELLESELFGHEKGAFTGAYQRKLGKFEFAHRGTLFLDEIGELPLPLQAKLLHVLQDREFFRLGGRQLIQVDTRVIASTNRNLEQALTSGQFREDLYYRLNVVEIWVPPLRERSDEIPALVEYFLERFRSQVKREVDIPAEAMEAFQAYHWPGNVRELENLVRRLVVLRHVPGMYETILAHLRREPGASPGRAATPVAAEAPQPPTVPDQLGLREIARRAARQAESKAIEQVLHDVQWHRTRAARALKVSYKTLLIKIDEYGLGTKGTSRESPGQ